MLACGTEHDRARLGSSVTIDGDELEVVDEFVYLGSLVASDNDTSREIRRCIISGSCAYYGLHKHLRSNRLSPVQNAHKTGCPLRARDVDIARGGPAGTRSF